MRRSIVLSDPRAVLLVNERSGRAAVQVPAPSLMLDDGEIERRVRLIRPMEQHSLPLKMMAESHWQEADRERFAAAWQAELAEVPEFTDSTIHIVAGLLLPIWKRLPNESTRVYRLQTDAGERIIGRKVSPAWVASALAAGAPTLTPDDAFAALIDGRTVLDLAEGLQLRRVRVMGAHRIELSGFTDTHARPAAGLRPLRRDHLLEAAHVRADRRDGAGDPGQGARALSDRAHRRAGGRVMPRDASELAHRLAREAEAVCRHYLSNGRREGRYWLVGDVRNTPGRSMFVRLQGPEAGRAPAGKWTDAATGEHGDLLDVIRESCGLRRLPRCRRRSATLPEPAALRTGARRPDRALAAGTDRIAGSGTAALRHVAADRGHDRGDVSAAIAASRHVHACRQPALPSALLLSARRARRRPRPGRR